MINKIRKYILKFPLYNRVVLFILLLFFCVVVIPETIVNMVTVKEREAIIVQEYQKITHPPGCEEIKYNVRGGLTKRWIEIDLELSQPISDEEIKKYYAKEFTSNGWILESETFYWKENKYKIECYLGFSEPKPWHKNRVKRWHITIRSPFWGLYHGWI